MPVILTSFYFQAAPSLPKVNTTERLKELRQKMQQEGVQAYIIPSVDQHMVSDFKTFYQLMIDMAMKCWQKFFKTCDIMIVIAEKWVRLVEKSS